MTPAGKIMSRLASPWRDFASACRLWRFAWLERQRLRRLEIGANVHCYVPLHSRGEGSLVIGGSNCFGYWDGPISGDGGILLQPRRPEATILIGQGNWFNNNVTIIANEEIVIGDNCRIGNEVAIFDSDFHEIRAAIRDQGPGPTRPVTIGHNVWLGSRVMILKGVAIGENSVIGAMSLVTRPIPANCLAAGNPAKVVRAIE